MDKNVDDILGNLSMDKNVEDISKSQYGQKRRGYPQ